MAKETKVAEKPIVSNDTKTAKEVKHGFDMNLLEANNTEIVSNRNTKIFDVIVRSVSEAPSTFLGKDAEGNLHGVETHVVGGITQPINPDEVEVTIPRKSVTLIRKEDYDKEGYNAKSYMFVINTANIYNPVKSYGNVIARAKIRQVEGIDRNGNERVFNNLTSLDISISENKEHSMQLQKVYIQQ
jgi:hypothetical protein